MCNAILAHRIKKKCASEEVRITMKFAVAFMMKMIIQMGNEQILEFII